MSETRYDPFVVDLRSLEDYRVQGSTRNVNITLRDKKNFLPIMPLYTSVSPASQRTQQKCIILWLFSHLPEGEALVSTLQIRK